MDNEFISSLKEKINIIDLINQYINLKKSGNNYKACCPFHKEKTPSFVVNEIKQSYKCFGCGKSGDIYSFIQDIENLSFYESVLFLADKFGIDIPKTNNFEKESYDLSKKIKELNIFVARYYYKNLIRNKIAQEYLKKRKINPSMVKIFGLGYADRSNELIKEIFNKFEERVVFKSGILSNNDEKKLIFKDRLIFPIFNNRNEVIGFGGRQLNDFGPKYINSPETEVYSKKDNLYALNIARKNIKNDSIFLVEGYMDVISMHQNGYPNTVASLGTSLTKEQSIILSKLCKNIFIVYDNDQAGRDATKRALDILVETNSNVRVVNLDDTKDPDEFFSKYDNNYFDQMIYKSKDYLSFNIKYLKNKINISNSYGLDLFVKESTEFIKKYINEKYAVQLYVENAIREISNISGYTIKTIGMEIYGKYFSEKQFTALSKNTNYEISNIDNTLDDETFKKEQYILYGILNKEIDINIIKINDFSHSENRKNYYFLKNKKNINLKYEFKSESSYNVSKNYDIMIKSIKNKKVDTDIKNLENVQKYLVNVANDFELAIKIGKKIIKLKNKIN